MANQKVLGVPGQGVPAGAAAPPVMANRAGPHVVDQKKSLGAPPGVRNGERLAPGEKDLFEEPKLFPPRDSEADPLVKPSAGFSLRRKTDPVLVSLFTIFAGLLLIFLAAQALSLWNTLQTLPLVLRWIGKSGIVVAALAVLAAMIRLGWEFRRLRASPQVSLAVFEELESRRKARQAAHQAKQSAVKELKQFLAEYPLDDQLNDSDRHRLTQLGFKEQEMEDLVMWRKKLLGSACGADAAWMRDVEKRILIPLDIVADRRIRRYAIQVGVKTAAAPTGFLDSAITLVNAYLLVADLCRIYNLRTGRWSTVLVLGHVFVNVVAAGRMEEVTDAVGEQVAQAVSGGITSTLAVNVTRFLGSRVAEGTANGLLLTRLGYATMKRLRPIVAS